MSLTIFDQADLIPIKFLHLPVTFAQLSIQTEASAWFIGLCLLAGAIYAALLYTKKTPWSKNTNRLLAFLRFALVSLLCFFLLGPMLNQVTFFEEKPIIILAVDNSESLPAVYDSTEFDAIKSNLDGIEGALQNADFELKVKSLNGYVDGTAELQFDQQATDIHRTLREIQQEYEQQNLAGVILASDGIHNFGQSPQFLNVSYPIYSWALGDTIPVKDLSIQALRYNKIVYQGNRFPLVVDVFNNGFVGESTTVSIVQGNTVLASQTIRFQGDEQINSLEFILDAEQVGIENYAIVLAPLDGESTAVNNRRNAYLEVVDSKQKILIAAKAPHPDIRAIRSVIEAKEGTETSLYLDGITEEVPEGPFDLVIMHQLPGITDLPGWLNTLLQNTSSWYISGSGYLNAINSTNPVAEVASYGQKDIVGPSLNPNFELFEVSENYLGRMFDFPPIVAPYGQYSYKQPVDILLYQRIGSVRTERPLLAIYNDDEIKSAIFFGDGLWKWKLQESASHETPNLFQEVIGKLIQYLSTTDDKRNFRVNTTSTEYFDNQSVTFETDVYNELFEKVYDYPIDLTLTDANGGTQEFNYVNSSSTKFSVSDLAPGIYRYSATTTIAGATETAAGTFSVKKLELEDVNVTANHQLLRSLSRNSAGQFFSESQSDDLIQSITNLNAQAVARSDEKLQLLLNNPWILLLLIALVSGEWFIRKYNGSY